MRILSSKHTHKDACWDKKYQSSSMTEIANLIDGLYSTPYLLSILYADDTELLTQRF